MLSRYFVAATACVAACASDPTTPPDPTCKITAVAVGNAPDELEVGESAGLTPSFSASGCTELPAATWESSNFAVAWVDKDGLLWATDTGSVTITVSAAGRSGTTTVQIVPPTVASIVLEGGTVVVGQGFAGKIPATVYRRSGAPHEDQSLLTWQPRNSSIATVSATGSVSALAVGRTWAVARAADLRDSVEIVVLPPLIAYAQTANPALPGSHAADPLHRYNPTGAPNTIERTGTGAYRIHWSGLQVAPGATTTRLLTPIFEDIGVTCWAPTWTQQTLDVRCVDADGVPTDAKVSAAVIGSGTYGGDTFFAKIVPSPSGATIDPAWSHHANAKPMTVVRSGVGLYGITVPRSSDQTLFRGTGIVVVTGDTPATCHTGSRPMRSGDVYMAGVRCVDLSGAPVDVPFQITFLEGARTGGAKVAYGTEGSGLPGTEGYGSPPVASARILLSWWDGAGALQLELSEFSETPPYRQVTFLQSGGFSSREPHRCRFVFDPAVSSHAIHVIQCHDTAGVTILLPFNFISLQ